MMDRTTHTPAHTAEKTPDDEMLPLELKVEEIAGFALLVLFSIDKKHSRFLIGVEMARILKQQTYNMYRSLKSKGIHLIRANQPCLSFLRDKKAVPRNTHSVTLVPYADGVRFILTKLREKQRIEMESKAVGLLSTAPAAPSPSAASANASLYQPLPGPSSSPAKHEALPSIFSFSPSFSSCVNADGQQHMMPTSASPAAPQGFPVNRFQLFSPQQYNGATSAPRQQPFHTAPLYQDETAPGDFSTLFSLACLSEIEAKKLSQKKAASESAAAAALEKKKEKERAAKTAGTEENQDPSQKPPLLSKGWIQLLLNSASPVS